MLELLLWNSIFSRTIIVCKQGLLILLFLVLYSYQLLAQNLQWGIGIGGQQSRELSFSIGLDANENIYTTGLFSGGVDFDPGIGQHYVYAVGTEDIFILKLDANGNYLWAKNLGGDQQGFGRSIALDKKNGVYTTGNFTGRIDFNPGSAVNNLFSAGESDIFISKLDTLGNYLWAKRIGGIGYDFGFSIAVDNSENVITTGYFDHAVDFDPGVGSYILDAKENVSAFISKLDRSGNFVWARNFDGRCLGLGIATDVNNNVYTVGSYSFITDFDPNLGIFNLISEGSGDIFITKLDPDGKLIWAKSIGGVNSDVGGSIAIDKNGNIHVAGYFQGTVDFDPGVGTFLLNSTGKYDVFICKLDKNGNFIWAKSLGGTNFGYGVSIALDLKGNVYTTGYFEGTVDFDPGPKSHNITSMDDDIFITKLDLNGNYLWSSIIQGPNEDEGRSIIVDSKENVYATGEFLGTIGFEPPSMLKIKSNGGQDLFIAKFNSTNTNSIENDTKNQISIFPNPTSNNVLIELGSTLNATEVTIINIFGQIVYNENFNNISSIKLKIENNPGIYFLNVKSGQESTTFKVIKL